MERNMTITVNLTTTEIRIILEALEDRGYDELREELLDKWEELERWNKPLRS